MRETHVVSLLSDADVTLDNLLGGVVAARFAMRSARRAAEAGKGHDREHAALVQAVSGIEERVTGLRERLSGPPSP